MNIAFVTRFFPPDTGGGGIAAYANFTATGLKNLGHRVCVISMKAPGSVTEQELNGIKIYRIPPPLASYRLSRLPLVGKYIRFFRDILFSIEVRQILVRITGEFSPDIVEYADIDAEGYFHPPIVPYVVKLHTPHIIINQYYSQKEIPYDTSTIKWLENKFICSANGLSSPSNYLADEIARLLSIKREKISYVPNPIDTNFFSPSSITKQSKLFLYVGRLEPRKGAILFAKSIPIIAKDVPDARFVFLGADRTSSNGLSQQKELTNFFNEQRLENRVDFYGHASPEVFREFYRNAQVFVMPSLFENCPYTLLEAMACEKACLVHNVTGMREMITDDLTGRFFKPHDPEDLAQKAIALINDPLSCERLGKNARNSIIDKHGLEVAALETSRFYKQIIS